MHLYERDLDRYDLIAKPDLYTSRHTQWFFFSVTNAQPNRRYIFNFINMLKPDSLFNDGMQPLMFSTESQQLHRVASELGQSDPDIENETEGWVRCGEDILCVLSATSTSFEYERAAIVLMVLLFHFV